MVNITYGVINATVPGSSQSSDITILSPNGTDLIATLPDGTTAAYSPGDISWVLTCTALVWIMIPGLGYLYSGLVRRKNALSLLLMTMICLAVTSVQWFFWGYSLAFSSSGGAFLGNLDHFGFIGVLEAPVSAANNKVPEIVYAIYEQMFACLVPAIAIGAACERGRIGPVIIFTFCWSTLVYCPLACWIWNPTGWAFKWGVLDYAGGVPVEICSGVTGLVMSIYLGKRRGWGTDRLAFKPHNVSHIVIGTVFLWVGWLGFNGGSTFAANLKAAMAITATNLAGSCGGLTWMLLDYRLEKKWSVVGFCTGAIAGLVAITPAAGFVGIPASMAIGVVASAASNSLTNLKNWLHFDDAMDIFACHAVSGIVGLLMTALFAQSSVAFNDGYLVIDGGWIDHHYVQLAKQLAWCAVGFAWTFGVTYAIMFVIDHIPYCHFRSTEEAEICGIDEDQCGEFAYDYAFLNRDLEGNYHHSASDISDEQLKANGNGNGNEKSSAAAASISGPPHPNGATDAEKSAWDRERNLVPSEQSAGEAQVTFGRGGGGNVVQEDHLNQG